jgi:hypothetical protein
MLPFYGSFVISTTSLRSKRKFPGRLLQRARHATGITPREPWQAGPPLLVTSFQYHPSSPNLLALMMETALVEVATDRLGYGR